MKRQVKDLIRHKGLYDFARVAPDASVFDALGVLDSTNSSAALVMEGDELRGIFSEKDFARASIGRGIQLAATVESVMTSRVYYAEPTFTLEECAQVMSRVHVRHLPVIESGKAIALLSMRHLMEILVEEKEDQIRHLTTYITGANQIASFQEPRFTKIPIFHATQSQEVL